MGDIDKVVKRAAKRAFIAGLACAAVTIVIVVGVAIVMCFVK